MNDKEEIYREYLLGNMHESDLIIQLDLLQEKAVKSDGVIYTPWNIVQEMVKIASPSVETSIIEPSCGYGVFLIGLLYYMNEKYNFSGVELYDWFKKRVVGIEISQKTVDELKEILSIYFLRNFKLVIEPNGFSNVYCHDGLTFNGKERFNLCIGNPPYIRAKNLNQEYLRFLKDNYESCRRGGC